MNPAGRKLLDLMFNPGDHIAVSNSKYGYHSIPLSDLENEEVLLKSPNQLSPELSIKTDQITMLCLNPLKGFRRDSSVTNFRSFLIELDVGPLNHQYNYIIGSGLPYSACIFSGSKSLHFLITLSEDLPDIDAYRDISEWILNILTAADQQTGNPTRCIRFPGAIRPETGKEQSLVELKSKVAIKDLFMWLMRYPDQKPVKRVKTIRDPNAVPDFDSLTEWVKKKLLNGLNANKSRNQQWFGIGFEMQLLNYSLSDTINILRRYFTPEKDFKEKEWETAVTRGYEYGEKEGESK